MSGDKGMNKALKAMGRNLARAHNQNPSVKGYAGGGAVECTTNPVSVPAKRPSLSGGGKSRGTGAQTKGMKFGGVS